MDNGVIECPANSAPQGVVDSKPTSDQRNNANANQNITNAWFTRSYLDTSDVLKLSIQQNTCISGQNWTDYHGTLTESYRSGRVKR